MENCGNTKKINFQFHHHKFSQQRHSILSKISAPFHLFLNTGPFLPISKKVQERSPPLPPLVVITTREGRQGLLSCTFLEIGRKGPVFRKR